MSKKEGSLAGFLVPSIIGIILFMIPVKYDDNWTIVVKIIADFISQSVNDFLPLLCVIIVTMSAVLGIHCNISDSCKYIFDNGCLGFN